MGSIIGHKIDYNGVGTLQTVYTEPVPNGSGPKIEPNRPSV